MLLHQLRGHIETHLPLSHSSPLTGGPRIQAYGGLSYCNLRTGIFITTVPSHLTAHTTTVEGISHKFRCSLSHDLSNEAIAGGGG